MADARAEIRTLVAERDVLEQRIAVSSERLRARGVDQHTPLIDREARTHAQSVCRAAHDCRTGSKSCEMISRRDMAMCVRRASLGRMLLRSEQTGMISLVRSSTLHDPPLTFDTLASDKTVWRLALLL